MISYSYSLDMQWFHGSDHDHFSCAAGIGHHKVSLADVAASAQAGLRALSRIHVRLHFYLSGA